VSARQLAHVAALLGLVAALIFAASLDRCAAGVCQPVNAPAGVAAAILGAIAWLLR
jgi:hypothetical protein